MQLAAGNVAEILLQLAARVGIDLAALQHRLDEAPGRGIGHRLRSLFACRFQRRAPYRERRAGGRVWRGPRGRSEEHTSELQSLMRISYAVFCLKKQKTT